MKRLNRNTKIYVSLGMATVCLLLFSFALAVGGARKEKAEYIASSQAMARSDLADVAAILEEAVRVNDRDSVFRAAGMAEAYLSRAGIEDCGELYAILTGICKGEYGIDICEEFARAAQKARDGDGGAALRKLAQLSDCETAPLPLETTEDSLSARVLKKIGNAGEDIAQKRARAFCCPNAVFEKCATDLHKSYIFSGDNVFIALEGERARVTMYCFDRELDERHTVTSEDAAQTVDMIVKKEKLKLADSFEQAFEEGIYRFIYRSESGKELVIFEIYSDTGRLRKYDAVNYYAAIN